MADQQEPVAIVGAACRFSGGVRSPSDLWDMLTSVRSGHCRVPADRWNADAWHHPDPDRKGGIAVNHGYFIEDDVSHFDAPFFSTTAKEASAMDPMKRLLLEVCYEGIENAGIPFEQLMGTQTGCYVGCMNNDYEMLSLHDIYNVGHSAAAGLSEAMSANRVSWFFGLTGPSLTIDTACSSSLYALHLACQSIRAGETNQALVAGINLMLTPNTTHQLSAMHMLSPEGISHTFDARANGYGRGEGIGCLVIKRLEDALRDGDTIRAVIRGTGANADGKTPSVTQPSSTAQADLLRRTYANAGLEQSSTQYFECHGTGTPVGDPIELEAVASTLGQSRAAANAGPLYIGSLKPNIGHTEGCSGLAGVLKAVLCLEHGLLVPTFGVETVNPKLKLSDWNLELPSHVMPWPTSGQRRVSVNSFGFGGANATAILDDAFHYLQERGLHGNHSTVQNAMLTSSPSDSGVSMDGLSMENLSVEANGSHARYLEGGSHSRLLVFSGKDQGAIGRLAKSYSDRLSRGSASLDELAWTLGSRRSHLDYRSFLLAPTVGSLQTQLAKGLPKSKRANLQSRNLVFVCTGQGAQWPSMGRQLLQNSVFATSVTESQMYLETLGCSWNIVDELQKTDKSNIHLPEYSQTLCTVLQIALIHLLRHWDVLPRATIGHSSGEIAAAYAANSLSHADAIKIAYVRGLCSSSVKREGAMLAVGLSAEEASNFLTQVAKDAAVVACVNSPSSVTLSGDVDAIDALEKAISATGAFARKLKVQTAYHSPHMRDVANDYLNQMGQINPITEPKPEEPEVVMFSSLTGTEAVRADLTQEYWMSNMCAPVQFAAAFESLLAHKSAASTNSKRKALTKWDAFIEIGPHAALQGPFQQIVAETANKSATESPYLSMLSRNKDAQVTTLTVAGHLWAQGYDISLSKVNDFDVAQKVPKSLVDLPPYQWNHPRSYWHESYVTRSNRLPAGPRSDLLGQREDMFSIHEPRWRNTLRASESPWIEDHKITGTTLYPGAGMLIMALEGAKEMADTEKTLQGFRFRDVEFKRGLVIPVGDESAVETRLSLFPDEQSPGRFQFRISSAVSAQWTEHCRGFIELEYAVPANREIETADTLNIEWQDQTAKYNSLLAETQSTRGLDVDEFYDHLESIGMEYGPLFRNTVELTSVPKLLGAHASVKIPDTITSMPANFEYPHTIHPATLDALFHLLLAAFNDGEPIAESSVPYALEDLYISAQQPQGAGNLYKGYGLLTRKSHDGHETAGDLVISDADWTSPKIVITNFALRRVTATDVRTTNGALTNTCAHIRWRRDVDFVSATNSRLSSDPQPTLLEWISLAAHKKRVQSILVVADGNLKNAGGTLELLKNLVGGEHGIESVTTLATESHPDKLRIDHQWNSAEDDRPECLSTHYDIVLLLDGSTILHNAERLKTLREAVSQEGRFAYATVSTSSSSSPTLVQDLFQAGFDNILTAPNQLNVPSKFLATLSSNVSQEVVVLVPDSPTSLTSTLGLAVQQKLVEHGMKAEILSFTATSVAQLSGRFVISLLEAEQPFVHNWSEEQFESFKRMVFSVKHMLWVTHGSILQDWSGGVEFAAAQGLLRVLRNEIPRSSLPLLDLSSKLSLEDPITSDIIGNVFLASVLPQSETEFAELEGEIFIPRAVSAPYFDAMLGEAQGKSQTRTEILENLKGTFRLSRRPGEASSLWVPADTESATPSPVGYEISVDVEILNVGSLPASNVVVGTVAECGPMVTTAAKGQRVICFGIEGCDTRIKQAEDMVFAVSNTDLASSTVALSGPAMVAHYALANVALVKPGHSVLVVNAETALGQASARVAKALGARVFALVESKATKDLLVSDEDISPEDIFDAARMNFVATIQRATEGKGVNVVIAGQHSPANVAAAGIMGEFGCFLELIEPGTSHIANLPPVRNNCTLVRVDSRSAFRAKPALMRETFNQTLELVSSQMQPRHARFSVSEIDEALALQGSQVDQEVLVTFASDSTVLTLAPPVPRFRLDPDGVYVLAGGLGALGLKIADMMVEQGARHLAFLSRSGGAKNLTDLEHLRALGVEAEAFQCNINDRDSTVAVFQKLSSAGRTIKGVVQSAMVLEDTIFENMTHEKWTRAFKPKTTGSRNLLDQLSPAHQPFFILLSSITGIIGNTAQANYASGNTCEDALANYARKHLGIPATSIDVGLVTDSSHFTADGEFGDITTYIGRYSHGWQGLQTNIEELKVIMLALMRGAASLDSQIPGQVVLGLGDRIVRPKGATGYQQDPKFNLRVVDDLVRMDNGIASVQEQLRAAESITDAAAVVELKIKQQVAVSVGIELEDVDVQRPLFDFGVDSLQAVELRTQVSGEMQSDVSVFELLSPTSIAELAHKIASRSELVTKKEED